MNAARQLLGGVSGAPVAPDVPVALRVVPAGAGRPEPRVLVGGVVGDPVDEQLDAALVAAGEQGVEVGQVAEDSGSTSQ